MRTFLAILLGMFALSASAAFTEFYCDPAGNNLNGGSSTGTSAKYSSVNGNWNGTSTYTPTDSSTPASSVSVGDWAHVYVDGATAETYYARVTAVAAGVNGTITLATIGTMGTAPSSSATGRSIKVGGAWKGPNGTDGFPMGTNSNTVFINGACTNASGDPVSVNLKAGTYSLTAGITNWFGDNLTSVFYAGYTTTPRDGGRAIIDGGTSGASYTLFWVNGKDQTFMGFTFQNNGATGSADLVQFTSNSSENKCYQVLFAHSRGTGMVNQGVNSFDTWEAFDCNQSNTSAKGGIDVLASGTDLLNGYAHHNNAGANCYGASLDGGIHVFNCIFTLNAGPGIRSTADVLQTIEHCDIYANSSDGIQLQAGGTDPLVVTIRNCNIFSNAGWGVHMIGTYNTGIVGYNNFGSGTKANASGMITGGKGTLQVNNNIYTANATPWVSPDTGNFTHISTSPKNDGYGLFLQLYNPATWNGTVGFPDLGAAPHQDTGTTAGTIIYGQ